MSEEFLTCLSVVSLSHPNDVMRPLKHLKTAAMEAMHLEKPKWYFLHYFTKKMEKMQFGTNSSNISNNAV